MKPQLDDCRCVGDMMGNDEVVQTYCKLHRDKVRTSITAATRRTSYALESFCCSLHTSLMTAGARSGITEIPQSRCSSTNEFADRLTTTTGLYLATTVNRHSKQVSVSLKLTLYVPWLLFAARNTSCFWYWAADVSELSYLSTSRETYELGLVRGCHAELQSSAERIFQTAHTSGVSANFLSTLTSSTQSLVGFGPTRPRPHFDPETRPGLAIFNLDNRFLSHGN